MCCPKLTHSDTWLALILPLTSSQKLNWAKFFPELLFPPLERSQKRVRWPWGPWSGRLWGAETKGVFYPGRRQQSASACLRWTPPDRNTSLTAAPLSPKQDRWDKLWLFPQSWCLPEMVWMKKQGLGEEPVGRYSLLDGVWSHNPKDTGVSSVLEPGMVRLGIPSPSPIPTPDQGGW